LGGALKYAIFYPNCLQSTIDIPKKPKKEHQGKRSIPGTVIYGDKQGFVTNQSA
jgi:hypothetical protein